MAFYLPLVGVAAWRRRDRRHRLQGSGSRTRRRQRQAALSLCALASICRRVMFHRSSEVLLLSVLGIVLLFAGAAEAVKVSAAVGAFLVGSALSGQVAARAGELVLPLRDLFAAVFFVFLASRSMPVRCPVRRSRASRADGRDGGDEDRHRMVGRTACRHRPPGARARGTALVGARGLSIVIAGLGVAAGVEPDLGPLAAASAQPGDRRVVLPRAANGIEAAGAGGLTRSFSGHEVVALGRVIRRKDRMLFRRSKIRGQVGSGRSQNQPATSAVNAINGTQSPLDSPTANTTTADPSSCPRRPSLASG